MIAFVESTDKTKVSVRAVREYAYVGNDIVQLSLNDGTRHEVNSEAWRLAIRDSNRSFVPAASGTSALRPALDKYGELRVRHEDVIAWRLNEDGFALPVVCSGTCPINERFPAIRHPSGRVDDSGTFYETIDEWALVKREELLSEWAASPDASLN